MEELRDLLLQIRNRLSSSSRQDQFLEMILSAEESLRLLKTNDDPIRTEELLRGPLNQCQTLLRQKRQGITDSHCQRGVLEEGEHDLVNIVEKIKRLFSYIRRCPPEIMREIFLNCVDFYHPTDILNDLSCDPIDRLINPEKAPVLLLHICKKWRHIALNTPKLFTQLYLPYGMIEGVEEEMDSVLHLFLTCSGSLALDLFLQANWNQLFSFRGMDMVSAQLLPCFSRICRIRMAPDFLPHLFPPDSCTDAPALLDFHLYSHKRSSDITQFGRLVAPKLEVFYNDVDVRFDWEGFITLGECLKIFSGFIAGRNILAKLHRLFQNSSNMEYCRFKIMYYAGSSTSQLKWDAPIFLPQLRDLSICSNTWIFLSQLKMPSLRVLQPINPIYGSGHRILSGIISSFISARPSLETLFIDAAKIQREEFHDLLRILPELTKMTLRDCEIHGALRALIPAYAPDVCPKLATLGLTESWSYDPESSQVDYEQDIIDIICSRACSRLSEDPEERTQRCLRYMDLIIGAERFSRFALGKIRRLADRYDIVIVIEKHEEESDGEYPAWGPSWVQLRWSPSGSDF